MHENTYYITDEDLEKMAQIAIEQCNIEKLNNIRQIQEIRMKENS